MATLTKDDRAALWSSLMSDASRDHEALPLDKRAFKALVDAVDDALSTALDAFSATLPAALKTTAGKKLAHRMFRDAAKLRALREV